VRHARTLSGLRLHAADEQRRRPRLHRRQHAVRRVKPPRVERVLATLVGDDDAHGATAAHRHERRALHRRAHDLPRRRQEHRLGVPSARERLLDRHGRAQIVPADRQRPHEIRDARDAVFAEALAPRRPHAVGALDGIFPVERRREALGGARVAVEELAGAQKALHPRAALSLRLGRSEPREQLVPVRAPRLRHARARLGGLRDQRRERLVSRCLRPRPGVAREAREDAHVGTLPLSRRRRRGLRTSARHRACASSPRRPRTCR
jgi:hypothetical protein